MTAQDVAARRSELVPRRPEADAAHGLIARLGRGPVADIKDMHRSVRGRPVFTEKAPVGQHTENPIADQIDCYMAASERFADAIILSDRMMA